MSKVRQLGFDPDCHRLSHAAAGKVRQEPIATGRSGLILVVTAKGLEVGVDTGRNDNDK